MDLVCRVMGLAAALGARTARFRINFIKLNWLLMVLLGFGVVAAGNEVRYALANGNAPRTMTVTDAVLHKDIDSNFVSVQGDLVPQPVFTRTRTSYGNTRTTESYYALLDDNHEHAVLVQTHGSDRPGRNTGNVTLTGMLMPISNALRDKLAASSGQLGQVSFDADYVLEWDRRPGDLVGWSITTVLGAIALLAMLTTWRNRYVVFRASGDRLDAAEATPLPDGEPLPVRASGVFQLGPHARRFSSMPALLVDAEGVPVVGANVDASSTFMGVKTSDRSGIWSIALPPAHLQSIELGYQYTGFARRPAVRLSHRVATRVVTTVLSCDDARILRAVADRVTRPAPALAQPNG